MEIIELLKSQDGNLLIRLLIAHFAADFIFQTNKMVEKKKWFSIHMWWHILVVAGITFLFSFSWILTLIISISHWITDSLKVQLTVKKSKTAFKGFIVDQLIHILIIMAIWSVFTNKYQILPELIYNLFTNHNVSILVFAYIIVIWPVGYLIGFMLEPYRPKGLGTDNTGKMIGIFERIIILSLVLLAQYEAIGFLITGKSIIRFPGRDESRNSEYVLLGTLVSYALAIIIGLVVNKII